MRGDSPSKGKCIVKMGSNEENFTYAMQLVSSTSLTMALDVGEHN
ncbi:hypothetical protein Tco_0423270, partial [Tanacetum coccineum]